MLQDYLRSFVRRAIYDKDLAPNACPLQTFFAPVHEFADCDFFVQGRNHDTDIDGRDTHARRNKVLNLLRHDLVPRALTSSNRRLLGRSEEHTSELQSRFD